MCFWSPVSLLVTGLRSPSDGPCSFRTRVALPGSLYWFISTSARCSVCYLFLFPLGDLLGISRHETRAAVRVVNGIEGLSATTDLGDPIRCLQNIYNTNDGAYTGNMIPSKTASKRILDDNHAEKQGILNFLYFFGVAMEIFVSPQNRGFLTRLNTAFTPGFWTAPGEKRTFDASVLTCALNQCRQAGSNR